MGHTKMPNAPKYYQSTAEARLWGYLYPYSCEEMKEMLEASWGWKNMFNQPYLICISCCITGMVIVEISVLKWRRDSHIIGCTIKPTKYSVYKIS